MVIFAALLLFVASASAQDAVEDKLIFSLHDSKQRQCENNTLIYESLDEALTKNGFYKFSEFEAGFNHYSYFPTLAVYRPDEKAEELHGYYLPNGLLSLLTFREADAPNYELYKPIRDYFLDDSTEAVTPFAAKEAYPYFYDNPLVKLIKVDEVARQVAVVFVAPTNLRKADIIDYHEVVRYYNVPNTKIIKDVY